MKRIKISLFALLALSVLAQSCKDNREANMSPNKVYVVNSGKVVADVYDTGENGVFNIGVTKSGYMDVAATVEIEVSAQALANYNAKNSLEIKPLPADCYTLASNKVIFGDTQISALFPIVFNTDKLVALGTSISDYALALELTQSNLQINFDKKYSIIMPTIKAATIAMTLPGESVLTVDKNTKTLLANLPVSVTFMNNWDIACKFAVNQADFDAFNKTKGGALTLLPADSYTITPANFVLAKGKQSGEIFVSIDKAKLAYANYCLPVRLAEAKTGKEVEKINPETGKDVSYLTINTLISIPRDQWTVKEVSSEEPEGNLPDGAGKFAIDSDVKTYWHSAWTTAATPPHHIVVDMGKNWIVGAITITPRGETQNGFVEISSDGTTWTQIGEFAKALPDKEATFPMSNPAAGRYLKFISTSKNAQIFDLKAMGGPAAE